MSCEHENSSGAVSPSLSFSFAHFVSLSLSPLSLSLSLYFPLQSVASGSLINLPILPLLSPSLSIPICQATRTRRTTGIPPTDTVHHLTSSIHVVFHLEYIGSTLLLFLDPSATVITCPSLIPFPGPYLVNFRFSTHATLLLKVGYTTIVPHPNICLILKILSNGNKEEEKVQTTHETVNKC